MSFKVNLTPFGVKRSREAQDFARRAANNLLPWIKEHYQIYTLNEANFTPAGLYNYHLRGDYYLGLTKNSAAFANVGLNTGADTPRLAHIAEEGRAFDPALNESIALVNAITQYPEFPGIANYGLISRLGTASAPIAPVEPAHFFTREVANGSILTEFLFAEQATMTYKLLPYVDKFHEGVRNFLVDEAMHFIDNISMLRNRGGNNFNTTRNVHDAFNLEEFENPAAMGSALDDVTNRYLPGFTVTAVGRVREDPNKPSSSVIVDLRGYANFTDILNNDANPHPAFVLPIYYVLSAFQEFNRLISPDLQPAMRNEIDDIFTNLFIEAIRTSYRIGGYYTLDGGIDLTNVRNFTRREYDGIPVSIQSDDFNADSVRNNLRFFFDVYFNLVTVRFPVGTIVKLNTGIIDLKTAQRDAFQEVNRGQTQVPRLGPAAFRAEMGVDANYNTIVENNTLFRITGINTPRGSKNKIPTYDLESVDEFGVTRTVTAARIREFWRVGNETIPAFTLFRVPNLGSNRPEASTQLSIIGRLLLSASYTIFNAGSYYTTNRDMRKLTKEDTPGHYPPLNEALGGGNARNHGRRAHQSRHQYGVIDLYAEQRADLIGEYLAAMYDSLKGKYRDDFVNFFTGDFHLNELDYYTSAVSNYISNQTAPEDRDRAPVIKGPRLTTRLPQAPEREFPPRPVGFMGPLAPLAPDYRQVVNYRNADPELVYYQIDSPLLRDVLRTLTTRFYEWYVGLAEGLDRGERTLRRGGLLTEGENLIDASGNKKDPAQDRDRIRPTKLILNSMWPLLTTRAKSAVESGEVAADEMMRRLARAVAAHRANTSQAVPAVPITTSFVNFGELLRSPNQYALPSSTDAGDVEAFIGYLESTYFSDYGLIALLAAEIEDARTTLYTQDQLISQFKKQYRSFRNEKALNRFTFPATATVISVFREQISLPENVRAAEAAIMTTAAPPAPDEQAAPAAPIPEPMRRI